jgi:histidinol phosphatase-like PHP family hydrolase
MVTIFRSQGLKVVIFTDDHEPAHVHVFGDGHVKINLVGEGDEPELIFARDMKRSDIRRAVQIVIDNQSEFLAHWRDIHG